MKSIFLINDTLENKISFYLISAFLIGLPFQHFYSEILLSSFAVHTLIHLKKQSLHLLRNKTVWIIASIFFLNLMTVSYSNYRTEGFKEVDHQLGILLFPVLLSVTNLNLGKYKFQLLQIFALTCVATTIYLYLQAFRVIYYFHLPYTSIFLKRFINQNFSSAIGLHATYLSLYVALSICIFLFLFFTGKKGKNGLYILLSIILFAGLIQLSSRSVFISFCLILIFAVPALLINGKQKFYFSAVSVLLFLFLLLAITDIDALRKRYMSNLENDLTENAITPDLSETRMTRWKLEMRLISGAPFTGYGGGAEKYVLKEKYFQEKFYRSFLIALNAHNEYLSFLINAGVFGLLLYLFVLSFGFSRAIKQRDFLLLSLMILLSLVSISENILDVNKGIFFYSFFFSFFLLTPAQKASADP